MTRKELEDLICEELHVKQCPLTIQKQIKRFTTELRYSYLDIAQALSFLISIKKQDIDCTHGIWKVEEVMREAKEYIAKKEREKQEQIEAARKAKQNTTAKIYCEMPQTEHKRRHIDINKL